MPYLKGCIAALTAPLTLALLLAVAAGVVAWRGRKRAAVGLLAASLVVVFAASMSAVGDWLLNPLEARYPPLRDQSALQAPWIVGVLSCRTLRDWASRSAPFTSIWDF
jgi:uncharacterized SAM-binding protein YcdF (DUF218 family)